MWQSKMFTEDQMVAWENKPAAQQTWAALQAYFTEKWLERKQYSATTAKQSRFKDAALLAQETAAAKEERELQAMLFAMLQKQPQKQKAHCPHCKKFVLHKPDNCTKLEANKDKRWPGWKSVHAIA